MTPAKISRLILLCTTTWVCTLPIPSAEAQTNLKYQQPPKAIVDLVDVLPTPTVRLSPAGATQARGMLIEQFSVLYHQVMEMLMKFVYYLLLTL